MSGRQSWQGSYLYTNSLNKNTTKMDNGYLVLLILVIVMCFICLLGIVGNVIAFVVLWSYRIKTSMDTMLMYLAVVDICLLALTITSILVELRFQIILVCFFHFQMMSIYAVVYLSIDRYMAICHPFRAIEFCRRRQARRAMFPITLLPIVYYSQAWIDMFFGSQLREYVGYAAVIWTFRVIDALLVFVIPLIVLFTLNILLFLEIRGIQASTARMAPGSHIPRSVSGAINIIAVVTVFLVTQTMNAILYIVDITTSVTLMDFYRVSVIRLGIIGLNSALNFVVYCAFFSKFRDHLNVMCRKVRRETGAMGTDNTMARSMDNTL